MIVRPGQRIKLPDQKHNALSLSYLSQIVAVCNAILNLRVKGGQFFLGSNNSELQIDEPTAATSNAVPGLPWQITEVDATTIQVSVGKVFVSGIPGHESSDVLRVIDSTNTATDITIPASSTTPIWVKCYDTTGGGSYVAEVNVGTPPSEWVEYPAPQHFDFDWATPYNTAYFRIGIVNNSVSPTVITQELFNNQTVSDFTGDKRASVTQFNVWSSGSSYRKGTIIYFAYVPSTVWQRETLDYGDSGNQPGTSPSDWVAIV